VTWFFGLKGQRSTLGLGLTAIQRGFELYECYLVIDCNYHLSSVSSALAQWNCKHFHCHELCCQQMETNIDSVYAIGDVAQFPLFIADNASVNIQHWQMAHQHGNTSHDDPFKYCTKYLHLLCHVSV